MVSILTETRRLLLTHGLRPKKRLGQSFLVDPTVLRKILNGAELRGTDRILEIGAGVGTLTRALAERCGRIIAVEIDPGLFQILERLFQDHRHVTLIRGDARRLDLSSLLGEGPWKVIANLPYAIVTPLIVRLLEASHRFSLLLLMVQQEVAERLMASPGTKAYGSLSVLAQYYTDVRTVLRVPRTAFYPRPQVDSAVVKFTVLPHPRVAPADPSLFFRLVRAAFGHRRKTLINALRQTRWDSLDRQEIGAALERASIDPSRRGETLSVREFQRLADEMLSAIKGSAT
jgi:16S rRNA (adenine1518-N6/adenine1519-N6)-dimethyltransferase